MKLYSIHGLWHYICTPKSNETTSNWLHAIGFCVFVAASLCLISEFSYYKNEIVLQIKYLIAFRFRLIYAVKPHTEKVTMVSLQTEANLIVTASQDCTLFFFRFATTDRGIDMDPIRCITLEHVAINFEWISLQVLHFYEKRRHPFYAIFPFPYFSNVFLPLLHHSVTRLYWFSRPTRFYRWLSPWISLRSTLL